MKKFLASILLFSGISITAIAQQKEGFEIVEKEGNNNVEILLNGKLLTAYTVIDSIEKPFLYPINTLDGITVTRGYPIDPKPGERSDHPHHTGLWMNYESVNGLDFWNNSTAIAADKKAHYGSIKHQQIVDKKASAHSAMLTATANWVTPSGDVLLNEKTTYQFSLKDNGYVIDRTSTLTAKEKKVEFKDVKDGFIAIRVARQLEMPTQTADVFVDHSGIKTTVPKIDNEGVTGMYENSEGVKGEDVWSSQGRWAKLTGQKEGKQITIGIIDHPKNVGYPTYWHARGYGLFAANPLGSKVFSKGKEELNFELQPQQSVTFKYRIFIASGKMISAKEMNALADDFAK